MLSPFAESMQLRLTEREVPIGPPDVAAFSGTDRALLAEQAAEHDDGSPLASLVAAGVTASRLQVHFAAGTALAQSPVFINSRTTPIPAIGADAVDVAPRGFDLATHARGHFVWVAPSPTPRAHRALALAVCLPLGLPDMAAAQEPVPPPPPPAATAPAVPPPVVAPAVAATSMPSRANVEAILTVMNGREGVVVARRATVTGLILGVEGELVTIVDYAHDGKIVMLPKSEIVEIRGKVPSPLVVNAAPTTRERGTGLLIGGSILVGIGTPLLISGLVFTGISISYALFAGLPQIIPAAAMLGAGIPMLVVGSRRRKASLKAAETASLKRRLAPMVGRTRHGGWTGGLTLQF